MTTDLFTEDELRKAHALIDAHDGQYPSNTARQLAEAIHDDLIRHFNNTYGLMAWRKMQMRVSDAARQLDIPSPLLHQEPPYDPQWFEVSVHPSERGSGVMIIATYTFGEQHVEEFACIEVEKRDHGIDGLVTIHHLHSDLVQFCVTLFSRLPHRWRGMYPRQEELERAAAVKTSIRLERRRETERRGQLVILAFVGVGITLFVSSLVQLIRNYWSW